MMPEDFPKPAGNVNQVNNGLYYTFQPYKLPVEINLSNKLLHLSHKAVSRLSTLGGRGESMDNPHLLITPYIRREALSSSKIEGTRTTLEEVYMEEATKKGKKSKK